MATAQLDPLMGAISATQKNGRFESMTRTAQVTGITATNAIAVINEMLAAVDSAGAEVGSLVTVGSDLLQLVGREPSRNTNDTGSGMVTLTYERVTSGSGTSDDILRRSGRASLRQLKTEKDREGNQITVTHEGVEQGGELDVVLAQVEPAYETYESTNDPTGLAKQYVGRVNADPWQGEGEGRWMIVSADWEEIDPLATPPKWKFRWSIQLSEEEYGWLPVVAYIDPTTNRPPPGLVVDEGIKKVPYYYTIDFTGKFGS